MGKTCTHCGAEMAQRYVKSGPNTGQKRGWHCAPCTAGRMYTYRRAEPDRVLDSRLWCFYRIRLADYRRMLEEQGGVCKACRRSPDESGLAVDHDHRCCPGTRMRWGTGKEGAPICGKCVRGLICRHCNVALAMVDDSPERLAALIDYLKHSATPADIEPSTAHGASGVAIP